jgi:hypothetical protein
MTTHPPRPTSRRAPANRPKRRAAREGKVRKEFWLDPRLLEQAQAFLGTATQRETVELALDLVACRRELSAAGKALRGRRPRRLA